MFKKPSMTPHELYRNIHAGVVVWGWGEGGGECRIDVQVGQILGSIFRAIRLVMNQKANM